MRRTVAVSIAALALLAAASCVVSPYPVAPVARPPVPPPPPMSYDVGLFYDALDPYGDWLHLSAYGWVWRPTAVALDFRPYTDGRWIYTDDGWMWIPEEPWGWGPYHYGRWFYDARHGWCWLPGTEWAPAWVVFRWGDGWFGWAPAPPGMRVRAGFGVELGGLDLDVVLQPFMWRFVPDRYAFETRVGRHAAPPARNVTIVRVTKTVTNYVFVENRIVNRGVDIDSFARTVGRAAPRYRIVNADAPGPPTTTQAREVRAYRPELRPAPAERAPSRGRYVGDDDRKAAPRPGTPVAPTGLDRTRQQPAPRPAPVSVPAEELEARRKREEAERAELERRLEAQKRVLRREHEREAARPPADLDRERLRGRHEAEKRAFEEEAKRQRELLLRRQKEREEGAANAPKTPPKKTPKKAAAARPEGERE